MSEARQSRRVMVAAFEGWNDACQAATDVIRHLVDQYDAREIGRISCDGYYDYQLTRPMMCRVDGQRRIVWPTTTFYAIDVAPGCQIIAQIAPEPNHRWTAYCRQSLRIAEDCDVDHIVTLGAMFGDCPHTRRLPLSVDDGDRSRDTAHDYTGPVGIPTVLDEIARDEGFDTTAMWVSVPQYLGADECAQGTLEMLERLSAIAGVTLNPGVLPRKAAQWQAQASVLVRCNDDLAAYVHHLEQAYDMNNAVDDNAPAAEQLVREAEAYLREL